MLDRAAAYKTSQVLTASPVERVVLLYRGAVRFSLLQVQSTERHDRQAAHNASLRAQEIVSALRETLDLSAGTVAQQLDGLYDFCLRRLIDGNLRQDAQPVKEAIKVLQGLLEVWAQVAGSAGAATAEPRPGVQPGHVSSARPLPGISPAPRPVAFSGGLR